MKNLGYREKAILQAFSKTSKALPVGYLIRETDSDPKTVDSSLRCLKRRGLVRRVRYGVWELVG
jgi:DNA-binding IclR family transcriptional regulator